MQLKEAIPKFLLNASFIQCPPMLTACKTIGQYHNQGIDTDT